MTNAPTKAVMDASALMAALLPGEAASAAARKILDRFAGGTLNLIAPTLLPYEVANSLLMAERKKDRGVSKEAIDAIMESLGQLEIPLIQVPMGDTLSTARHYNCWAYDATYLALAEREKIPLIAADKRLYNAVKGKSKQVVWVEDFLKKTGG